MRHMLAVVLVCCGAGLVLWWYVHMSADIQKVKDGTLQIQLLNRDQLEEENTKKSTEHAQEHMPPEMIPGTANIKADPDLIVLAAPSINDEYYGDNFQSIIDFDVAYAQAVLPHDNIRIVVDRETRPYFDGRLNSSILIDGEVGDIWMRDFSTINPYRPVQFEYSPAAYGDDYDFARQVQSSFNNLFAKLGYAKSHYYLDGGNVVDSHTGRVVVTERFLDDNDLSYEQGVVELKRLLNVTEVAIIPADDPVLSHADGMVMFIDHDVLVVNRYDEPFRSDVIGELRYAFGEKIQIIEVEIGQSGSVYDDKIGSACGININAVVTRNAIYVPHFGDSVSDDFISTIRPYTNKAIVPVDASGVCSMGGSVRCLSWQLHDEIASQLLDVVGTVR